MVRNHRSRSLRVSAVAVAVLVAAVTAVAAARAGARAGQGREVRADQRRGHEGVADAISSSDELQGRQIFTEGYGLAAPYIADHLKEWGVKPLGDDGTYFQTVKLQGLQGHAQLDRDRRGQRRRPKTFKHGDHVTFARTRAASRR